MSTNPKATGTRRSSSHGTTGYASGNLTWSLENSSHRSEIPLCPPQPTTGTSPGGGMQPAFPWRDLAPRCDWRETRYHRGPGTMFPEYLQADSVSGLLPDPGGQKSHEPFLQVCPDTHAPFRGGHPVPAEQRAVWLNLGGLQAEFLPVSDQSQARKRVSGL